MKPEQLIEGARVIEAVAGSQGREWDVILIEAGLSKNGRYYPADALKAATSLFEGAAAFADHATDSERQARPERSVRDKVGRFSGVQFGQHEVGGRVIEGLRARFKAVAPWLREVLKEAVEMDEPDFLGFSIDAEGRVSRREHGGKPVSWVEAITQVHSVDVVTDPAAGGRFVRLVASNRSEGMTMDPEELKKLIAEQTAAAVAAAVPGIVTAVAEATKPVPAVLEVTVEEPKTEGALALSVADRSLLEAARVALLEQRIDRALTEATGLSEVGRRHVRRALLHEAGKGDLADDAISARIKEQADYEAAYAAQYTRPLSIGGVAVGDSAHDKMDKALRGWFIGEAVDGIPPFGSLKEAYCRWTGQDAFEVDVFDFAAAFASNYDSRRGHKRVRESLTRASWGEVFADNLYVMMVKDYREETAYSRWRLLVSDIENVPDFQTRHWVRLGGYGDLTTVAEQGTYPPLTSPTDEEVSYSIAKRGGLDDVTFETLIDGRSNRMRLIPQRMSRSAKRTLYKFVMNLATTDNPTMDYDSTALYDSGHSNTGTTALSVSGLETTQIAMRDQTAYNQSLEILGERNKIKYIIVPNELEARANRIVNPSDAYTFALSSSADADTQIDPQRFKGSGIVPIVYDQLTDATDWWAVANPAEVPTMVVGFLNGNQEPELFVQDDPTTGSVFTADKVTFKIRHIYGGDILEHRSFYRQVVAG